MEISEKQELIQLVKICNNLSDILRKQGKSVSGDAIKLLKQKLEAYEIPYNFNVITTHKNKLELKDILLKDKSYKSQDLKKRLIQAGLKLDKCELCGQGPIWQGKVLTLQLDHINGNHNDNRLENLQILCPNCHSQTETFGNKKVLSVKHCPDCGRIIGHHSKYCKHCSPKHVNPLKGKIKLEDRPTKEELFNLIKNNSFC